MTGYAADTWGISGPRFLVLYVAIAGVVLAIGLLWRWWLASRPTDAYSVARPGPAEIAYLSGGSKLAVYSSLAALRAAECVGTRQGGGLATGGVLPAGATDLDRAVYHGAARGRTASDLRTDSTVARALDATRDGLERGGSLYPAAERRRFRWAGWAMFAVLALGVSRTVAGLANHKPVGNLVMLTALVLVVALLLTRAPRITRQGQKLVDELRRGNMHLHPREAPSHAVYGATGAALGVALFGAASLWAADPAFAADAQIARQQLHNGFTSFTGDSGTANSCGGGGGCGGGGCGGGGCGG